MNTDRFLCKAIGINPPYKNTKWVHGNLLNFSRELYINPLANTTRIKGSLAIGSIVAHKIDPNTLCQCTGKKLKNDHDDDNGILLYEGDEVKATYGYYYKGAFIDGEISGVVTWFDSAFFIKANRPGENPVMVCDLKIGEVLGNIHDNIDINKKY